MGLDDLAAIGIAVFVFIGGLLGARFVARRLLIERARRADQLESRGIVYGSDMIMRVALIFVWAGFAFGSVALLPGAAWIAADDAEAGSIALRLVAVGLVTVGFGVISSLLGLRLLVLEDDRLTRAGPFAVRSLSFVDIECIYEARGIPALLVRAPTGRIRVARSLAGFDDLFTRLIDAVGPSKLTGARQPATTSDGTSTATAALDGRYLVGNVRLGMNIGFLGLSLIFFLAWPWFLVDGEHPIRDSFIFVGIGLIMWVGLAFIVGNETLQRHQPIELELRANSIAWRTLRGSMTERAHTDLVSASVEPWIMYVKGQPGRRYPLRLRFVDDEVLEIDDFRGRHLGSSTHLISVDLKERYLTTANREADHQVRSDDALLQGQEAEARGAPLDAVVHYRRSVAAWPSPDRLALYGHIADLFREHGTSPEHRTSAIAHYRAHVDTYPSDATAWQGLGVCLSGGHRTDSADEAIATAEQLIMSGRDTRSSWTHQEQ